VFSPDYTKRDYLLPAGCKDLIDAINLEGKLGAGPVGQPVTPMPPPKGDIFLPRSTTLREFAEMLGQEPFRIIGDAMELGIFANVRVPLPFEIMAQIARKHGFTARKAA